MERDEREREPERDQEHALSMKKLELELNRLPLQPSPPLDQAAQYDIVKDSIQPAYELIPEAYGRKVRNANKQHTLLNLHV